MPMRILGLDPGLRCSGWACLDLVVDGRGDYRFIDWGVWTTSSQAPLAERLSELSQALSALLSSYTIERAAMETAFVQKNVRSALLLGHARGALLAALGCRGIAVSEVEPRLVKQTVAGSGKADKQQLAFWARRLVGASLAPDRMPPRADASDALAIALCEAWNLTRQSQLRALGATPNLAKAPDVVDGGYHT